MKKIIAHIIPFLMVMPFFSACEDEIIVTTGDIIGNVSDQTTGEPIPTANVKLEPSGRSVVTGRDGNYQFSEVEGGTGYTITIAKEGYNSASRNVTVVPGQKAEVNFTLERIPAVVTADRDVLDFGDGKDVTTLPFNIVNAGYEDLEWHIEYDCGWIKEVKDNEGVLKHGKTQTIVVFIDREQLAAGENKTILVVRSSNGSSEVTVTAVGQEKKGAVLNTLDVKDVTGRTAVFCGEIVEEGYPEYTKRGFVYSLENTPTKDTSIEILTAKISDEKVFSVDVKGLELNTKYYVRAYAESALGTFYASNTVSFVTSGKEPVLSVQEVTDIDLNRNTAVLNGTVEFQGEPPYTEKGFVYATKNNPTIYNEVVISKGDGEGVFSEKVEGLKMGEKYHVRAYAKWNDKVYYSPEEVVFVTETAKAEVSVQEVTNMDVKNLSVTLNGSVDNPGNPSYSERGFVYGTYHNPTVKDDVKVVVEGNGTGAYSANIYNLVLGQTYYVRAYAVNESGTSYSPTEVSFTIEGSKPSVTVSDVSDIDLVNLKATFHGSIENSGVPVYTEKGFVYGTSHNPTISDNKLSVKGSEAGAFSAEASGLVLDQTYYVRAYATNNSGTSYSPTEVSFSMIGNATLELSSALLDFGTDKSEISVDIENTGNLGDIDWEVTSISESWLQVLPASGTLSMGKTATLKVLVDRNAITQSKQTAFTIKAADKEYVVTVKVSYQSTGGGNEGGGNDGGDGSVPEGTITSEDSRIIGELTSVKRNGTTVTVEYTLRNDGIGDMEDFHIYTCVGDDYKYTKIYDEEFNNYETTEFIFHDTKPQDSYKRYVRTRFPEKVKIAGKIVIRDFAETSEWMNIEMRIGSGYSDPELEGSYIYFKNLKIEGASASVVDETDGKDYSSAKISTGDTRIEPKILSCRRNGTTVTLEYRLKNNGIGDLEDFHIYTCVGDDDKYTKIYDEEFNDLKTAEFTFHDTKPQDSYKRYVRTRFSDKVKTKGKITIQNVPETSDQLNIEMTIGRGYSDPELNGNFINMKNIPIY